MRKSRTKALRRQRWEKFARFFGAGSSTVKKAPRREGDFETRHKTVALTRTEEGAVAVAAKAAPVVAVAGAGAGAAGLAMASIPQEDLEALEAARDESRRAARRASVFISVVLHLFVVVGLFFVVLPSRMDPPQMVVAVPEKEQEDPAEARKKKLENLKSAPTPKSRISLQKVVANMPSPVAAPEVDILSDETLARATMPATGIGLGRGRMNFGANFDGSAIGGMMVRSKKLGVVLDSSPSMTPYLPALRAEIRKNFRGSIFREIKGCTLAATNGRDETAVVTFYDPAAVMIGIKELVQKHKVDAIYWFCDLQDQRTEAALDELDKLLRGGLMGRGGVRLYVRSVDQKPDRRLEDIISRSGGEIEIGPLL